MSKAGGVTIGWWIDRDPGALFDASDLVVRLPERKGAGRPPTVEGGASSGGDVRSSRRNGFPSGRGAGDGADFVGTFSGDSGRLRAEQGNSGRARGVLRRRCYLARGPSSSSRTMAITRAPPSLATSMERSSRGFISPRPCASHRASTRAGCCAATPSRACRGAGAFRACRVRGDAPRPFA